MTSNACLNTALMLEQLSGEPKSIREVVTKRFGRDHPLFHRIYQRLSGVMHKDGAPEAVDTSDVGKKWTVEAYKTALNPEAYDRARVALRIIQWLVNHPASGKDSDGAALYARIERTGLPSLTAIENGLSQQKNEDRLVQALHDLSDAGRTDFLFQFGLPLEGIVLKEQESAHALPESTVETIVSRRMSGIPYKIYFLSMAAIVFLFVALSPFNSSVALGLYESGGVADALLYATRSGLLQNEDAKSLRTVAFLQHKNGENDRAIGTARRLLTIEDLPQKIAGDAYLVTGNSELAKGFLANSCAAFGQSLSAYETAYDRTYALGGLAKTFFYLGDTDSARDHLHLLYDEYLRANNHGDLESFIFLMPQILPKQEALTFCDKYLDFFEKTNDQRGVADIYLAISKLLFFSNPEESREYASKALIISLNQKIERLEIFALGTLAMLDGLSSERVKRYCENDYILQQYLFSITEH